MDEKKMEQMIQMAAAKLGMSPEQLKKAAASGNMDGILSRVDNKSADKIRSAMQDKKLTETLLNSLKKNNP